MIVQIEEQAAMSAREQIDKQIAELSDWRGARYAEIRKLIHEAYPAIVEEFKWGTGVFTHNGNVCSVGAFRDHLKINFFQGAAIPDPHGLFNASLDARKTRAIDLFEGDPLNTTALKELIRVAVEQKER
jgi:hypothetical protein